MTDGAVLRECCHGGVELCEVRVVDVVPQGGMV